MSALCFPSHHREVQQHIIGFFSLTPPPQETRQAGSTDAGHLQCEVACQLQVLAYGNTDGAPERLGHSAPLPEGARAPLPWRAALAVV